MNPPTPYAFAPLPHARSLDDDADTGEVVVNNPLLIEVALSIRSKAYGGEVGTRFGELVSTGEDEAVLSSRKLDWRVGSSPFKSPLS
jgi:hypothetical protein